MSDRESNPPEPILKPLEIRLPEYAHTTIWALGYERQRDPCQIASELVLRGLYPNPKERSRRFKRFLRESGLTLAELREAS